MTTVERAGATVSTIVALSLLSTRAFAQTTEPSTGPRAATLPVAVPAGSDTESAGTVAGRVVAELLMGSGLATVGFLTGPRLVGAQCGSCRSAAGLAGASATFPLGVYWGGRLVRARGSFWLTVAAPWLVSATTFVALARDSDYDGKPAAQIGLIGGAVAAPLSIVLFELTNSARRRKAMQEGTFSGLHVAVGPRGDGVGLVVGFQQ